MRRNLLIIAAAIIFIFVLPIAMRKNSAFLGSVAGEKAFASRSVVPIIDDGEVNVYLGDQKIFGLWQDSFDSPLYVYPFADAKRYLCVYNRDTAILVFVADLDSSRTNQTVNWPVRGELRDYLARGATKVMLNSNVLARMATDDELQEVRDHLSRASEVKIKAASLPYCDLGVCRSYEDRATLLLDLATNRQNYWPMPGAP